MLRLENVSLEIGEKKILDDINFELKKNTKLMVIGHNGAGKSSLAKAITQNIKYKGKIYFENKDLQYMKATERAQAIGYLMQTNYIEYPFTVEEIVSFGRYPYRKSILDTQSELDKKMIDSAMETMEIDNIRTRSANSLSGGELQKVFLAQVLAQDPKILILDEVTNHLDISIQEKIFNLIDSWVKKGDRAVISIVHDLTLAKLFSDNINILKKGKIVAEGKASQIFKEENINKAYNFDVISWMKKRAKIWIE